MSRLLPMIDLDLVSKQSCSNARTLPVKQIVCRSFIAPDVTELTELVQFSLSLQLGQATHCVFRSVIRIFFRDAL